MLAQFNSEGARGYAFLNPIGLPGDGGKIYALYAKGSANTYTYEILDTPTTAANVLAQANAQGARGFRRVNELTVGTVYAHVVGSTATYSYESLPSAATSAAFVTQANAEGSRGFLYTVDDGAGGVFSSLYVKSSAGTATYTYATRPAAATASDFVTAANAQGAQGYLFHTGRVFNDATVNIYVKDVNAASTFSYLTQPAVNQAAAFVAQANAQGATGTVLMGEYLFGATFTNLYFTPHACTGALCGPVAELGG